MGMRAMCTPKHVGLMGMHAVCTSQRIELMGTCAVCTPKHVELMGTCAVCTPKHVELMGTCAMCTPKLHTRSDPAKEKKYSIQFLACSRLHLLVMNLYVLCCQSVSGTEDTVGYIQVCSGQGGSQHPCVHCPVWSLHWANDHGK